jgi:hypothetical protein
MKYEEAKQLCHDAFLQAEKCVGSNKEAIALEVAVMASYERDVMDALFIVAQVNEPKQ